MLFEQPFCCARSHIIDMYIQRYTEPKCQMKIVNEMSIRIIMS